jgi:hypothetical protein
MLLAACLFILLAIWWVVLHMAQASSGALQLWAASYQIIAFVGAIVGLKISVHWGGTKSIVGRAIIAFSCGLLLQCFGQSSYSWYIYYLHEPVPYPSIGDIGYFGSIVWYLYGAWMLAKASGVRISLRTVHSQLTAVLIPLVLLWVSYLMFLHDYSFDWSQPLKIFLDFGYPLGQATYVSVALLTYFLSRKVLGGIMRLPVLCLLGALVLQYSSDFSFLYQANAGSWYAGGWNDFLYMCSYLAMTLALAYIGTKYSEIESTNPTSIIGGVLQGITSTFSQIASNIIHEQALVIGPLAWSEATKVPGLAVDVAKNQVLISGDDERGVIDRLVSQYTRLFGEASRDVCKQAVASVIVSMSPAEIPISLQG